MAVDQSNLECQICFDNYDNQQHQPKILPCGHVFCRKCLGPLAVSVRCILCNKDHKLADGLDSLPTDRFRLEILENLHCMDCGQLSPKTKKCDHCALRICKPCRQYHHTVQHCGVLNQLRDIEDRTAGPFTTRCQQKLRAISNVDTDTLRDQLRKITDEAHKVLDLQHDDIMAKLKRIDDSREKLGDAFNMREFVKQTRAKLHSDEIYYMDSLNELKSQCDSKQAIIADVSRDSDPCLEHIYLDELQLLDNIRLFGTKLEVDSGCKFLFLALFFVAYQWSIYMEFDSRDVFVPTLLILWFSYLFARLVAGKNSTIRKALESFEEGLVRFIPAKLVRFIPARWVQFIILLLVLCFYVTASSPFIQTAIYQLYQEGIEQYCDTKCSLLVPKHQVENDCYHDCYVEHLRSKREDIIQYCLTKCYEQSVGECVNNCI